MKLSWTDRITVLYNLLVVVFIVAFGDRDIVKAHGGAFSLTSGGAVPFQVDGDYAGVLPLDVRLSDDWVEINT